VKITPLVLLSAVSAQIAALCLAVLFWLMGAPAGWIAPTAWALLAVLFLSALTKKRHCYSSLVLKRVRDVSVFGGIVVLICYLVATRVFRMTANDASGALFFLGGMGPFLFLTLRDFGRP
jgi:hypothetical protein